MDNFHAQKEKRLEASKNTIDKIFAPIWSLKENSNCKAIYTIIKKGQAEFLACIMNIVLFFFLQWEKDWFVIFNTTKTKPVAVQYHLVGRTVSLLIGFFDLKLNWDFTVPHIKVTRFPGGKAHFIYYYPEIYKRVDFHCLKNRDIYANTCIYKNNI